MRNTSVPPPILILLGFAMPATLIVADFVVLSLPGAVTLVTATT